ncbi:MAG: aryl-sulfate sulfotransferase [Candidatus Helarchaeota archaeon]
MVKKIKVIIILIVVIVSIFIIAFSFWLFRPSEQKSAYYEVVVYKPDKVYNGTTLFTDGHDPNNPKVVEVDMQGHIIWEYILPDGLKQYTNPGMEAELLSNGHILIVLPWGGNDSYMDLQIKEINESGSLVWSWRAYDYFYNDTYKNVFREGWTHCNSVTRMSNGHTLINLRNFNMTIEVNQSGDIVWSYNWTKYGTDPHEPELLPNDNLLIGLQWDPVYNVVELNRSTGDVVWNFTLENLRTVRDADRLPNNNTLIQGVISGSEESTIIEVTPDGEIVWQLNLKNAPAIHFFNLPIEPKV